MINLREAIGPIIIAQCLSFAPRPANLPDSLVAEVRLGTLELYRELEARAERGETINPPPEASTVLEATRGPNVDRAALISILESIKT